MVVVRQLQITAAITDRLSIDGFWPALFGALLISVISALLHLVIRPRATPRHA